MPRYEITAPDGRKFEITAPEGATQEQVLAYAQQNFEQPESKQQKYDRIKSELDARNGTQGEDPTAGMSTFEKVAAGVGKSIVDTGRGLGQLVGLVDREDVDRARQLDAPLMDTKAGFGGNVAGAIGQVLIPGAAAGRYASLAPKIASAVRAATLPKTIGGAALQGGALGALQPVGTGDSRGVNAAIGMGAGAVGAAIPRGIGATARAAKAPFAGMTAKGAERRVADILRREAVDAASLERSAPSAIAGVQRTLAEESLDPGIAILQRGVFARTPEAAVQRANNNAARVGALRGFAGDDAAVAAAEKARNTATAPLRKEAIKATGVDTGRILSRLDRTVKSLDTRPAVQKPLAEVAGLLRRDIPESERMGMALEQVTGFLESGARRSAADHEAVTQAAKALRMRGQTPDEALAMLKQIKPQSVGARQAVESAKKLL